MSTAGHVFVVQGDLMKLACDEVLVPTDCWRTVEPHWGRWAESPIPHWEPDEERVTGPRKMERQLVRYVDVGAEPGATDVAWLRDGIRQGLVAAAKDLIDSGASARHGRARPLLGMPVVGVGAGGFGNVRGEALKAVLTEAGQVARGGLDVAIVCRSRADYVALQSRRSDSDWTAGPPGEILAQADRLGDAVRAGSVALFIGAGVSRAAGLPDWAELLVEIAAEVGEPSGFHDHLRADPPRAASLLVAALGAQKFRDALTSRLRADGHAVGHALVASLRVGEVVTTNVDSLYELACKATFEPGRLSVLPWYRTPGRPPWLLKLHGDLVEGDMVFTHEDYERYSQDHGVLGAVVQSLLVTRNLVFIGYSMRDRNFLRLAGEVVEVLRRSGASHREIGTVLSLVPVSQRDAVHGIEGMNVVVVGDDDDELSAEDARQLELFLDRMAWAAADGEVSWVLDPRYEALLTADRDAPVVASLRALPPVHGPVWRLLRETLAAYGAPMEPDSDA